MVEISRDVSDNPSSDRGIINTEGEKGVKEEGTAPAAHTMDPARSDCLAVDAY